MSVCPYFLSEQDTNLGHPSVQKAKVCCSVGVHGGRTLQIGTRGTDTGNYAVVDLTVSTFCRERACFYSVSVIILIWM